MLNGWVAATIGLEMEACALIVGCKRASCCAVKEGWGPCQTALLMNAGLGKFGLQFVIVGIGVGN